MSTLNYGYHQMNIHYRPPRSARFLNGTVLARLINSKIYHILPHVK